MCEGKRSRSIDREREIEMAEMEIQLSIDADEAIEEDGTLDEEAGHGEFIEGPNAGNYEEFMNGLDARLEAIVDTSEELLAHPVEEVALKKDWKAVLEVGEELRSFSLAWIEANLQDVDALEQDVTHFLSLLIRLLQTAHASTFGSDTTLLLHIRRYVGRVVAKGLKLVRVSTNRHGSEDERRLHTISMVSEFWHRLDDLKKTPRTNASAIGSEIMDVADSISQTFTEIRRISDAYAAGIEETDTLGLIWSNVMMRIPSLILLLRDSNEERVADFEAIVVHIEAMESVFNSVRAMVDPPPYFSHIEAASSRAAQALSHIRDLQDKIYEDA